MKVAERAESLGYIQRLEALRSRSNILRSCELSAKCVASGIGYRGYAIPRGGEWRCWGGGPTIPAASNGRRRLRLTRQEAWLAQEIGYAPRNRQRLGNFEQTPAV